MIVEREYDPINPCSCDECARIVKTTFAIRGTYGSKNDQILLCYNCKEKLFKGKIKPTLVDME